MFKVFQGAMVGKPKEVLDLRDNAEWLSKCEPNLRDNEFIGGTLGGKHKDSKPVRDKNGCDVQYYSYKAPFPVSNRDFLVLRRARPLHPSKGKGYETVLHSTLRSEKPDRKGVVRAFLSQYSVLKEAEVRLHGTGCRPLGTGAASTRS
jgi:hypothetical protein